jgi:hypothetical protein
VVRGTLQSFNFLVLMQKFNMAVRANNMF